MKAIYESNLKSYEVNYDECDDLLTVESYVLSAQRLYAESFYSNSFAEISNVKYDKFSLMLTRKNGNILQIVTKIPDFSKSVNNFFLRELIAGLHGVCSKYLLKLISPVYPYSLESLGE